MDSLCSLCYIQGMTITRRILSFAGLFAVLTITAPAARVSGILMDKMCSARADKEGGQKFAAAHDKKCALEPPCQKSGYGVYTADGKFLTLDDKGNVQALAALKATKSVDNLKVTIDGTVQGSTVKVNSLHLQ
jgi:hypothetical protein